MGGACAAAQRGALHEHRGRLADRSGGDDSATRFFSEKTRKPLGERFLPIVRRETAKVSLSERYNVVAERAAGLGLISREESNLDRYVNDKALDGLYRIIAEEERKIRHDPLAT